MHNMADCVHRGCEGGEMHIKPCISLMFSIFWGSNPALKIAEMLIKPSEKGGCHVNRFTWQPPFLAPRAALAGPGRGPSLAVGPAAAPRGIRQNPLENTLGSALCAGGQTRARPRGKGLSCNHAGKQETTRENTKNKEMGRIRLGCFI